MSHTDPESSVFECMFRWMSEAAASASNRAVSAGKAFVTALSKCTTRLVQSISFSTAATAAPKPLLQPQQRRPTATIRNVQFSSIIHKLGFKILRSIIGMYYTINMSMVCEI